MTTSAISKLNSAQKPQIETTISPSVQNKWGLSPNDSMVISTPKEVNEVMRCVPLGRLVTINSIRQHLAHLHNTTIACPITTGIFVNIAAKAAEEMRVLGMTDLTPYWRVLKTDGTLMKKFPKGMMAQKAKLESEGFEVIEKGKKMFVKDFEKFLFTF
jgi:hypothetical protein